MTTASRSVFDREFAEVRDNLLRLGSLVDAAINLSIVCLRERDAALARQVIDDDAAINDLRFKIEEECMVMIATQQPMAGDLRAIVATMNVVNDLERMADHAPGIAKTVLRMGGKPLVDIPRMAETVREMLKQSLDAFLKRDIEAARANRHAVGSALPNTTRSASASIAGSRPPNQRQSQYFSNTTLLRCEYRDGSWRATAGSGSV
ncbi:MAG: hypothetical protein HY011_04955 [Acidobacteria bacterium]|nr:hypothetical protein [Acidobacteriota bacterium]